MPSGVYNNDAQSGEDFDGDGKGDVISVNISRTGNEPRLVWRGYLTLTGTTLSQQWGDPGPFSIDIPLGVQGLPAGW